MYHKIKNTDEAIKEYRKVIDLSPDYSWAYFNLAQIFYEKEDYKNAIIMLNMTLEKNKKDSEAYKLLCQLYIKTNDYNGAKDTLDEMEAQSIQNGDRYYLEAVIAKHDNNLLKYKDNLENAIANKESLTFDYNAVLGELKNAG